MRQIFTLVSFLFSISSITAQSVGIGTSNPVASAKLDISSTTQGMRIPRMTTAQRNGIIDPADGLLVFDKDKQTIYYYDGEQWTPFLFAVDPKHIPSKKLFYQMPNGGDDGFGESADLKGNYAIVGAPTWEPITASQTFDYGKAFIYFRNNGSWGLQTEIAPNANNIGDKFGTSVAISDNWAVVGTPYKSVGANSDEGSVFVFKRSGTTWTQFAELTGSNATTNDNFGFSVSIDDNIIVVGAPGDDINIGGNNITDQGSVYVFEYNGSSWVQRAKLYDPIASLGSKMGYSVDVDVTSSGGYYLIAGAPFKDVGANLQQGSAYIWGSLNDPSIWTQLTELTDNGGNDNDNFGFSVSVKNQNFGVGAPNFGTTDVGRSYYFKWNGSSWVEYNVNSGNDANSHCGRSVCVSNDKIISSIPGDSYDGLDGRGWVGVYYAGGSNGLYKSIPDAVPQSLSLFGYLVCMHEFNVLVLNTYGELQFYQIE